MNDIFWEILKFGRYGKLKYVYVEKVWRIDEGSFIYLLSEIYSRVQGLWNDITFITHIL